MKRKILTALALVCMLASIPSVSYAATETGSYEVAQPNAVGGADIISPYYVNTIRISANLAINGSTATANANVTAKKVCSISVTMRLQRKEGSSWHTVVSWVGGANAASKSMTKTYSLSTRGTYRVNASFNVAGEALTENSASRTY